MEVLFGIFGSIIGLGLLAAIIAPFVYLARRKRQRKEVENETAPQDEEQPPVET